MEPCAAVSRNGLVTVDVTRLKPVVPGAWCPILLSPQLMYEEQYSMVPRCCSTQQFQESSVQHRVVSREQAAAWVQDGHDRPPNMHVSTHTSTSGIRTLHLGV